LYFNEFLSTWLCNSLPISLRRTDTELGEFKQMSNMHLFSVDDTAVH